MVIKSICIYLGSGKVSRLRKGVGSGKGSCLMFAINFLNGSGKGSCRYVCN